MLKFTSSRFFRISAFVLALGIGAFFYTRYNVAPNLKLTEISGTDMYGKAFDLSAFDGHPLIISYFATWCIDCRKELPKLALISDFLTQKGIEVILLSDEDLGTLKKFSDSHLPAGFHLYKLDRSFKDHSIYTLPTNYVVCERGELILEKTGGIDFSEQLILDLLNTCKK